MTMKAGIQTRKTAGIMSRRTDPAAAIKTGITEMNMREAAERSARTASTPPKRTFHFISTPTADSPTIS